MAVRGDGGQDWVSTIVRALAYEVLDGAGGAARKGTGPPLQLVVSKSGDIPAREGMVDRYFLTGPSRSLVDTHAPPSMQ